MAAYSRLARLPSPKLAPVSVRRLDFASHKLETRVKGKSGRPGGDDSGDADQLEQLLINLVHQCRRCSAGCGTLASVGWSSHDSQLEVWVRDDGPGIQNTAIRLRSLLTIKPGGTGIGLALSRQIGRGAGGTLTAGESARDASCEARLRLPR